jgi:parallel beta-helix repeat protein
MNQIHRPRRLPPAMISVFVLLVGSSAALLLPTVGFAARPTGCTTQVAVGQSIQAAIDGVQPGATVCVGPGTYRENLLVTKDHITLQGSGAGTTVLARPSQPAPVCLKLFFPPVDLEQEGINGICIANVDADGNRIATVSDVRVTGFTVEGFPGAGIVFAYTNRPQADHNVAIDNGYYGITAFASAHGRFEDNQSHGSGDAGIYLGNSADATFTISNNTVTGALWGILVRDSSVGTVTDNNLQHNCSGLVFLNTGAGLGVQRWVASGNIASHNDKSYVLCTSDVTELPFTLTGLGMLILGGEHILLRHNTVSANRPIGIPTIIDGVALAGGIAVVSSATVSVFPGYIGSDARHNLILDNTVQGNQPFDLAYDGLGADNLFLLNSCGTSSPVGLCR